MVYVSIKELYITVKLAPELKKSTVYFFSYTCSPLNKSYPSILTKSMLRTYNSDIDEHIFFNKQVKFLDFFSGSIPMFLSNNSVKVAKIRHAFAKLHRIDFTLVSLCLQINGKQNTAFQFSVELIPSKCTKQH